MGVREREGGVLLSSFLRLEGPEKAATHRGGRVDGEVNETETLHRGAVLQLPVSEIKTRRSNGIKVLL